MNVFVKQYFWSNIKHHKVVNQQYFSISFQILLIMILGLHFFFNMTPKAAILDAGDTLLLSNLDKPWYLYCNEHNNVPIPIPACDYTVINRSLLCYCQLQGGNEFYMDR